MLGGDPVLADGQVEVGPGLLELQDDGPREGGLEQVPVPRVAAAQLGDGDGPECRLWQVPEGGPQPLRLQGVKVGVDDVALDVVLGGDVGIPLSGGLVVDQAFAFRLKLIRLVGLATTKPLLRVLCISFEIDG